jgi:hypothetical protein
VARLASMRFRQRDKTISPKEKSAWHSTILQWLRSIDERAK